VYGWKILHSNVQGLIYIQEFLDCHTADIPEEYLEQLTVQMNQEMILMLLCRGLSSEQRATDDNDDDDDLVRDFFEVNHFMDRCLKFKNELEAGMEICRRCIKICRSQSSHRMPLLLTRSRNFCMCPHISEAEHSSASLQDGANDILQLHKILK
jgi:hypothetical protein